jgi:hypothetical protein
MNNLKYKAVDFEAAGTENRQPAYASHPKLPRPFWVTGSRAGLADPGAEPTLTLVGYLLGQGSMPA